MSTFKSKQEVNCAFCDWRGRRDKLAKHVSSKHPNEKPRTKDQSSISKFLTDKPGDTEELRTVNVAKNDLPCNSSREPSNKVRKLEDRPVIQIQGTQGRESPVPSCAQDNNDADDAKTSVDINQQLSTIFQTLSSLTNKVDVLLKPNESVAKAQVIPTLTPVNEEFETKIKILRICKSVPEICQIMPFLEGGTTTIQCSPCVEHYRSIPKEIAILKTGTFGIFSLPSEKQLMQPTQSPEFRNLKTHIIDHLESNAHNWCIKFSETAEKRNLMEKKEHEKVGLRVARSAYSAIKEGKGGKYFERLLSLNVLNGADVGELNHSTEFFREYRKNVFFTMNAKICDFLSTKNPVTNHLPLVSITADKITKLHRTYQITCLVTLVEGVQTCIVIDISPCGTSHKGVVLVEKLQCALESCKIKLSEQLNGMAFDGQYFDLGVDKKLASLCKDVHHDFFLPMWDLAHRLECVLNYVRKVQSLSWLNNQAQIIGHVMKRYNWGIGYEELIALAEKLQVDVLNPKSFQETRFVQSELRVYQTFRKDFKLFFIDLHKKRTECIRKGSNANAKDYSLELSNFSRPCFIYQLLGTIDILELITKFSCTSQNVNTCIWTIFDHYNCMKSTLNDMATELKQGCITEKNFPSLVQEIESLKNHVYQDCLLVNEDSHRSSRSQTQHQDDEVSDDESFKLSRKKLETFCVTLLEKLTQKIIEPPVVENMRKCFSSNYLTNPTDTSTEHTIKESLEMLVTWVNENRGCNLDSEVLFSQLNLLKTNLLNTPFFKDVLNCLNVNQKPKLMIQDNTVIKEAFTNPDVYANIPEIIYLLENCLKICSEAVCESVGSVIGNHLHNRNIQFDTLFHEVFISWNGPPVHKASQLLKESLDRHFHGGMYHFTRFSSASRLKVYKTSKVIDNLHKERGRLPFLGDN